jgi:hypothetical protein
MRPYLRNLRIAWTLFCGLLCVLLVVLWVRSYWICDSLRLPASETEVNFHSLKGTISTSVYRISMRPARGWEWGSQYISQMMPVLGPGRSWYYRSDGPGTNLAFPHRFLILIAALFAAAPWIRWRFTLRTMLFATTIIAALLSLIVYVARR